MPRSMPTAAPRSASPAEAMVQPEGTPTLDSFACWPCLLAKTLVQLRKYNRGTIDTSRRTACPILKGTWGCLGRFLFKVSRMLLLNRRNEGAPLTIAPGASTTTTTVQSDETNAPDELASGAGRPDLAKAYLDAASTRRTRYLPIGQQSEGRQTKFAFRMEPPARYPAP